MERSVLTQVSDIAPAASKTVQRILDWEELPQWMRVDPHIRRGYRSQQNSFSACLRSLTYPHNELMNTWSHLLPGLYFCLLLVGADYWMIHTEADIPLHDKFVLQLYIAGTAGCLLLSVCT